MEQLLKKISTYDLTIKSQAYTCKQLDEISKNLRNEVWEITKMGEIPDFSSHPLITIFLEHKDFPNITSAKVVLGLCTNNAIKESANEFMPFTLEGKTFYHAFIDFSGSIIESKKISMEYRDCEKRAVQELNNMLEYAFKQYLPEHKLHNLLNS
ncbi:MULTISPECIES: hypothetical protein [unclassified Bacillus cereus group]|uniref:hypothetical protein n=1 Tax=unclassified Bacillus cereus group TaxID=2750818 RepID=UPI001F564BC4|nr:MULTISPECIES: hypothetical protein [unclassified Bacillus cereus group]